MRFAAGRDAPAIRRRHHRRCGRRSRSGALVMTFCVSCPLRGVGARAARQHARCNRKLPQPPRARGRKRMSSSSTRLAVDIGGTFTDLVLDRGARRCRPKCHHDAPDAALAVGAVLAGRAEAGRSRPDHPRHDADHQRADRAQGRAHGAGDHRGLPRFAGDRLRAPLRAVRHLHGAPRAAGAAPAALRDRRTHRGGRHGAAGDGRSRRRTPRRSPRRRRRRGGRALLPARLPDRRARAARARDHRQKDPRGRDRALQRGLPGDPQYSASTTVANAYRAAGGREHRRRPSRLRRTRRTAPS